MHINRGRPPITLERRAWWNGVSFVFTYMMNVKIMHGNDSIYVLDLLWSELLWAWLREWNRIYEIEKIYTYLDGSLHLKYFLISARITWLWKSMIHEKHLSEIGEINNYGYNLTIELWSYKIECLKQFNKTF